jgi:glycosyltransferase involved in cell wall biosynthesis
MCRLIAKLFGLKVVSTFHCGDRGTGLVAMYTWLDRLTQKMSENIAVSQEINTWLGGEALVMDNFIGPESVINGANHGVKNLAFVGRLSYEKGPDTFVCAARSFLNDPSIAFSVLGDGPMGEVIRQEAPENVKILGFCESIEWEYIDALVIASRQEGMPMVAIEAMMRGIPVIATPCGDLPRMLGYNKRGWLAKGSAPRDLIDAIVHWKNSSPRIYDDIIKQARDYALSNFSGESQWRHLAQLYSH